MNRDERIYPAIQRVVVTALCLMALCSLCFLPSQAYADACPAGGEHTYDVSVAQYATETEDGIRLFVCTKCGASYQQAIPATGHQWSPWIVDLEPTCTSEGHEYRVCEKYPSNPHYEYRLIPALSPTGSHEYVVIDEKAPTCTEVGYQVYACSICGETYREETAVLGHEWSDWVVEREPTATTEGSKKRVCAHDATHVEYESIPTIESDTIIVVEEDDPEEKPISATQDVTEEQNPFFSGPNVVDAVVLGIDLLVLIVFTLLVIPLIYKLRWIKKRKEKARQSFIKHIKEGEEAQ